VVNLRVGGFSTAEPGSLAEPFGALAQMQQEGLIRHLGVSTVTPEQIAEARSIAPIVCVQNFYNIAHRHDDELIDSLATQGIAYVPYFPLGGFTPLQSDTLNSVAGRVPGLGGRRAVRLALWQAAARLFHVPGPSASQRRTKRRAGTVICSSSA